MIARFRHWLLYLPKLQVRFCLRVLERHGLFWFQSSSALCLAPGLLLFDLGIRLAEWLEQLSSPPGMPAVFALFVMFVVFSQFGLALLQTGPLFWKLLFKLEPGPSGEENRRKAVEKLKVWSQS